MVAANNIGRSIAFLRQPYEAFYILIRIHCLHFHLLQTIKEQSSCKA